MCRVKIRGLTPPARLRDASSARRQSWHYGVPSFTISVMVLKRFHDGVTIPEFGIRIPWLITEPELFQLVPRSAFTFSPADWPMLQCSILGIHEVWGFN